MAPGGGLPVTGVSDVRSPFFIIACLAGLLVPALCAEEAKGLDSHYRKLLASEEIEPTKEGLAGYLDSQDPSRVMTKQYRERVGRLIEQLDDRSWKLREKATQLLIQLPVPPLESLKEAMRSESLEVSARANRILAAVRDRGATRAVLMHAVFRSIKLLKIKGLAAKVAQIMPHEVDSYVLTAGEAALIATAVEADGDLLRQLIKAKSFELRRSAVGALGKVFGTRVGDELHSWATNGEPRIRLAAVRALADQGDRRALEILIGLLSVSKFELRLRAIQYLRSLSHKKFGFRAFESEQKRKVVIEKWRAWLASEGAVAKLYFPLASFRVLLGRTLVCMYQAGKVLELDSTGKQVWEKKIAGAMAGVGLPSGHRVIVSYNKNRIMELDAKGQEVWARNVKPGGLYNVSRASNGNTLVACYNGNKLLEIRPDGSTAWTVSVAQNPISAERLANGRTLVSLFSGSKVVEVDQKGKEVWSVSGLSRPMHATRLENGNTLVCQNGARSVVEYDRNGKVVWKKEGLQSPRSAQRLSNGNTLISSRQGLQVVDRSGAVVWQKRMTGAGVAHRY